MPKPLIQGDNGNRERPLIRVRLLDVAQYLAPPPNRIKSMQKHRQLPCYDEYLAECQENPVLQKVKAKKFVSRSKGWRNGKQRIRKEEKPIILVKYGDNGFHHWDGGDTTMQGRIPWDDMATEIYGEGYCRSVDRHLDDHLRAEIKGLLYIKGGKV